MPELSPDDDLARFIFRPKDELTKDGHVRQNLFKPKRGEALSVYDVGGMAHPDICQHGRDYADAPAIHRIHTGYAALPYSAFLEDSLTAEYDDSPPRHVSIQFPAVSDETALEIRKALAARVTRVADCDPPADSLP